MAELSDPYLFSIFDEEFRLIINMGVYGAPETFMVDHQGLIRMRYAGVVNAKVWQEKFAPIVKQIQEELRSPT